ncbi:cadherin-like domain-containing protein [Paraglaciecola aquimarina]|uniref:Cadherin-like domain-containing protein n=1 Tax=Paraglaciecola algarum TaxID=3050085 RepID=A0ABS9D8H4_9ALTE|nr:Ig-like domain-containing protein [Paraglaciecola sp. G1-23]MCF2949176.1 cadherin-like domain-containing protein [Paraglaciecola sp. G1-23]
MNIKLLLVGTSILTLSGCFNSDNELTLPDKNYPPSAIDASFVTQTDMPINGSVEGADPENNMLVFALEQDASNGMLTLNHDGSFTYTPSLEFTGADEFSFSVSDGKNPAVTGTATITVEMRQIKFSNLSREAFSQSATDEPLRINGRVITNDVEDPSAFDDLLLD